MTTNHSLTRAAHLFQISRYADAETELRRALAEQPHDPQAHALLGLCLARQERLPEAEAEVNQAITLAPDWDHAHYCRSAVLQERRRYAEAEEAAREAVRLDPASPDNYARLAITLYSQNKWQATLDAAHEGLKYNGEHADCMNLRTMALTKLGRQREAIAAVDESLARDPDDSYAHANKAWALLHEGKPRPALDQFREALRLDPTNEYARHGMVEALKARNPIYRLVLGYFLWMARLDGKVQMGILLGGFIGARMLGSLSETYPAIALWILPVIILYVVFVLLTWFATPLFNLLLRFNRFGRHALSRDQRIASNWFALCLALSAACAVGLIVCDHPVFLVGAFVSLGTALPLTSIFNCQHGWPRQSTMALTLVMAIVGAICVFGASTHERWAPGLFQVFMLGVMFNPLIVSVLQLSNARR
ncbi:tetratricopeptide repeat protein [Lacipirellula sp.]|uniref:tetratricopeptide repeat protein n=1 Tax=Lacipirellula sp. TaxID=2691419 RepID=UPI003D11313E